MYKGRFWDERRTVWISLEIPIDDPLGHVEVDSVESEFRINEVENQQKHVR